MDRRAFISISHGKGKEAEKALIAAYRACDSFDV